MPVTIPYKPLWFVWRYKNSKYSVYYDVRQGKQHDSNIWEPQTINDCFIYLFIYSRLIAAAKINLNMSFA